MAGHYGDFIAKHVVQGAVSVNATTWTPLRVGSANLSNRRHVQLQTHGKVGNAVAICYANVNQDGTFTTPTGPVTYAKVYRGTASWVEPVGDSVTIYGRLWNKAAATESSLRVIVTEYK